MRFCSNCGQPVARRIPPGDTLERHVCDACGEIHYQNPKMVVGAIPVLGDRILLARRAIEPRLGLWTLPAGFMENNESTGDAAVRETREEACAEIELEALFSLVNIPHISQVHLFYLARLVSDDFAPGEESLETRLFRIDDIPWDELAFRSISITLKHYLADRATGRFTMHVEELAPVGSH
ncbi:MAG: NUDIX hydrolase [Rhodocyclaceae bacterium]|nr:NUDIX hydrolase [Rhodocyclaceae bacterium]